MFQCTLQVFAGSPSGISVYTGSTSGIPVYTGPASVHWLRVRVNRDCSLDLANQLQAQPSRLRRKCSCTTPWSYPNITHTWDLKAMFNSSFASWHMMTSSNGNIFRVTGHLCGEFTGPGEFPTQRPVTRSFDVYFDLRLNKRLSKQSWGWWFETLSRSLWRHRNERRNPESSTMPLRHQRWVWDSDYTRI